MRNLGISLRVTSTAAGRFDIASSCEIESSLVDFLASWIWEV